MVKMLRNYHLVNKLRASFLAVYALTGFLICAASAQVPSCDSNTRVTTLVFIFTEGNVKEIKDRLIEVNISDIGKYQAKKISKTRWSTKIDLPTPIRLLRVSPSRSGYIAKLFSNSSPKINKDGECTAEFEFGFTSLNRPKLESTPQVSPTQESITEKSNKQEAITSEPLVAESPKAQISPPLSQQSNEIPQSNSLAQGEGVPSIELTIPSASTPVPIPQITRGQRISGTLVNLWRNLYPEVISQVIFMFLTIIFVVFAWIAFLTKRKFDGPLSIAGRGDSDKPLTLDDHQSSWLSNKTAVLTNFIRTSGTKPPITVAITGPWGSGKSSYMQLAKQQLELSGFHTVWFNAWHSKGEQALLTALLQAINDQAIPRWFQIDGFWVRIRLLWQRAKLRLVFGLALILFIWLLQRGDLLGPGLNNGYAEMPITTIAATFIAFLIVVRNKMTALGISSKKLVHMISPLTTSKSLGSPITRNSFSESFMELNEALGKKLIIFIDDLDRCEGSRVMDTLQSINFLTTSGDCFFVLGMDPNWIKAWMALDFDKVSAVMPDSTSIDSYEAKDMATNYLQKLINIEIPVPVVPTSQLQKSISSQPDNEFKRESRNRTIWKWWLLGIKTLPALTLAIGIFITGGWWAKPASEFTVNKLAEIKAAAESIWAGADSKISNRRLIDTSGEASSRIQESVSTQTSGLTEEEMQLQQNSTEDRSFDFSNINWAFFAALLVIGYFLYLYYLRLTRYQMQDSKEVREALEAWTPSVRFATNTPRSFKTFINRVRMLCLHEKMWAEETKGKHQVGKTISPRIMISLLAAEEILRGPKETKLPFKNIQVDLLALLNQKNNSKISSLKKNPNLWKELVDVVFKVLSNKTTKANLATMSQLDFDRLEQMRSYTRG